MRIPLLLLALPLLLAGCRQPSDVVIDEGIAATATPPVLRLTNRGDRDVFWVVFETSTAARVDWIACVDPARCPHLAPGETRAVPYEEITGYGPEAEDVIVYWWQRVPSGNGYAPDGIRALRVRL